MGSANGGSRYAVPLRIIPDLGQVSENLVEPSTKQSCDVLHDDVARSYLANKSGVFAPETAALAFNASTSSRRADVLTGEASDDNVHGNSVCSKLLSGEFSNVSINRNLGPMLVKDANGEGLDLAERDGLEPARPLKAEVEAADASEQGKNLERLRAMR